VPSNKTPGQKSNGISGKKSMHKSKKVLK